MKIRTFRTVVVVSFALAVCLPVWADSVLTTIAVGNEPAGIAANPRTDKIYVALDADLQVGVIDGKTNRISSTIPLAGHPVAIAVRVEKHVIANASITDPL